MPRTSTSFKPGHKGMGGRPKGTRNGSSNAWRAAAKSVQDVARRADEVQSGLMNRLPTMTLAQLVKLVQVLRKRRAAYIHRSAHVREVFRSGGIEIAFGNKVVPKRNASPPAFTKSNRLGEQPDAGALRAAKKGLELGRDLETVQEELCKPSPTSKTKVAELTNAIAALDELSKAEKIYLEQSGDPRPVVIRRPTFRIQFLGVPRDSLRPEYTGPMRILGGLTPAEFYGGETKYRAAMEAHERDTQEFYRRCATREEVRNDSPLNPTKKFDSSTVVIKGEEYAIITDDMGDQPSV